VVCAVVSEGGYIKKCMEEVIESVPVSDELRRVLLMPDSEYYSLYSDAERQEFLFRLFSLLAVAYLSYCETLHASLLTPFVCIMYYICAFCCRLAVR
jgi:hypothetical protein